MPEIIKKKSLALKVRSLTTVFVKLTSVVTGQMWPHGLIC